MFRHFFDFESQPHARVFRKGDIKYVILDLLKDKPSHGYDIMREGLVGSQSCFLTPSSQPSWPRLVGATVRRRV
jgi:hypothetical protein